MSAQPTTPIGIERLPVFYRVEVALLALLAMLGLVAFFDRILLAPTPETWGLFTANYVFLLGLTQFGVAFSAIMRISGAHWPAPFFRIGDLMTIGFIPFALLGLLVIFFLGQEQLFHWAADEGQADSPWLSSSWLLIRNLGAQTVFYALAIAYFLTGLRPDVHADAANEGPIWRRALYARMLESKRPTDPQTVHRRLYVLSILVLAAGVLAQTFLAWDFGMMLYHHYHSSVFSMHFIMSNIFAGTAALLLLYALISRHVVADGYVGNSHFHKMASLLTGFTLLWLYLWWSQFFVSWFGGQDFHMAPLRAQMQGHYAPFFWVMMACVFLIPLVSLIFRRVKTSPSKMLLLAGVIVVGIWINRYLIVMPALSADHVLFSSFAEFVVTFGWFASYLLMLLILLEVFPAIARWESEPAVHGASHEQQTHA